MKFLQKVIEFFNGKDDTELMMQYERFRYSQENAALEMMAKDFYALAPNLRKNVPNPSVLAAKYRGYVIQGREKECAMVVDKNGAEVTPGYWYVKTNYKPNYTIVSVVKNSLSGKGELMVFMFDHEGDCDPEEFEFLGMVPSFNGGEMSAIEDPYEEAINLRGASCSVCNGVDSVNCCRCGVFNCGGRAD